MKKYTDTHEWISFDPEAKTARIGITEEGQSELGEIVFVSLPLPNQIISRGEEVVIVESSKAATAIDSPLSGRITAINTALEKNPSLLNQSAEEEGWLFQMVLEQPEELDAYLEETSYRMVPE